MGVEVQRDHPRDYSAMVRFSAERWAPGAGAAVRAQAVLLAPVDSGNLRGSITWKTVREDGGFNAGPDAHNRTGTMITSPGDAVTVHVGTNVDYAQHVEYGAKQKSRETVLGHYGYKPFLRPAIDAMRKKLTESLAKILREEAKKDG